MSLTLSLLGAFDVRRDGLQLADLRSQRAQTLLAYLAIEPDRPHERDQLCALLWPDEPRQAALDGLRQTLHRLREALEPAGEEGRYLVITRQWVQLNGAAVRTDCAELRAAVGAVEAHRHRSAAGCAACVARALAALELWRGELLPGFGLGDSSPFEEWLQVERERARHLLFRLLDLLVAHHERRGEAGAAAALLRRWLALDPWDEQANLRLIATLARAGQRATALRQFERYRVIMEAELGAEPSPAALRLAAQVRAGAPMAPADDHAPARRRPPALARSSAPGRPARARAAGEPARR